MATSVFRGFKIKGIDEKLLPSEEERAPLPVRGGYRDRNITVVEFPRHKVFILLEPVRNSDDTSSFNIDSDIMEIWLRHFNNGAGQLEYYHLKEVQQRTPGNPVKSIDVIGYSLGNNVRICVTNTHVKEVEELISEPTQDNSIRRLKSLIEYVNYKTLWELERNVR